MKTAVKEFSKFTHKHNSINFLKSILSVHKYIFLFIGGIMFATPYIWEWLFPLTFISLILLFSILNYQKDNKIKICFNYFFIFFGGCFLTVYTLFFNLYPFEGFNFTKTQGVIIVIFAWIAASLIHSFYGGVILSLSGYFRFSPILFSLSVSSLWVIFEWSMSLGFLAFPWVNISVSLIKFLPFLQTASLFGNGIITFITVFSSSLLGIALSSKISNLQKKEEKKQNKISLVKISCIVLSVNTIIGTFLYFLPENKEEEINVCIVQGNVAMGEKWDEEKFHSILESHNELIRNSLDASKNKVDVVLMAETVFPAICTENGLIYQTISKIAKDYDVTVIFGAMLKIDNELHNAVMAIYPDGNVSDYYSKQKLVPFGEKMPNLGIIGELIPQLKELNNDSSYIEGKTSKAIKSYDGTLYGTLICYDSVFSEIARQSVKNGADIIAISTNDSWYKNGFAVKNHKNQSVIRAIETGRYVFRSANTGISCIITSKGDVLCESKMLEKTVVVGKGYTIQKNTLFVILGNTSLFSSFALIILLLSLNIFKKCRLYRFINI